MTQRHAIAIDTDNSPPRTARRLRWYVLLPLCCVGCLDSLPGKPTEADRYRRPDTIMDFATLYKQHCSGCHGADGTLGPAPPLNDSMFLTIISDAEIKQVLDHGRAGTPMPAMNQKQGGPLTDQQIEALIAGIREKWGAKSSATSESLPKYAVSVHANGQPVGDPIAGKQTFADSCASCHGEEGRGDHALNDRGFLGTISNQALRRIIITGRPDLGMPNYQEAGEESGAGKPLSSEDIDDLVALLSSWRSAETDESK